MNDRFEKFDAAFEPVRLDDLRDDASAWFGRVLTWQRMWLIENGPYEGQWACSAYDGKSFAQTPFAWVPECDLRATLTVPVAPEAK